MFEEDYESPAHYQIALKDSPYEWSGALVFTNTATTTYDFILRNRADSEDILFMELHIIKYKQMEKFKI